MPSKARPTQIAEYLKPLEVALKIHADGDKAGQMKKYMRDQFSYFGIPAPQRRYIFRSHWKEYGIPSGEILPDIIEHLWRLPQREYQYCAMEMLDRTIKEKEPTIIQSMEYMITHKSWWDTVDFIAASTAGKYFKIYPEQIQPVTERWIVDENMWLNRSAILFQLKYKKDTDTARLFRYISSLTAHPDSFIRKAIGWALREYSKTDPEAVERFVQNTKMAPLSEREAMRIIKKRNKN